MTNVVYTGGTTEFPTYKNLGDHSEGVELQFDPELTSYEEMLEIFWQIHDPTKPPSEPQPQYQSAIFYHSEKQRELAEESLEKHQKLLTKKIMTKILPVGPVYRAEDYHQKHYLRVQPEILNELQLSDEELVLSNSAARLNGYCGGYGTLTEFDNDAPSFKISLSSQEKVKELIAKGPGTDDD